MKIKTNNKKIETNNSINTLFVSIFLAVIGLFFASRVQAATFFMNPQNIEVKTGDTFTVDLRVNSGDEGFNAAEANIQFPKDIVTVKSIDFSPTASVFNFWIDGPSFSNASGNLNFVGGTTNGVVGASIGILKITLIANNVGNGSMAISDSAITASDGSGTNILTAVSGCNISVMAATTPSETTPPSTTNPPSTNPPSSTSTPGTTVKPGTTGTTVTPNTPPKTAAVIEKLPEPVQITREPVPATEVPKVSSLALNVPFYPDQNEWHNLTSSYLAQWKITPDISGISTAVNKNIIFTPPTQSEGLFESKFFPSLEDGIWYLHLMLKNNKGWGDVTSYRLAIDTVPPLPFVISAVEGEATDNPTPTLQFEAKDALSGLDHYLVRVDGGEDLNTTTSTLKLPVQTPGKKNILVKAVDQAGNIREGHFSIEILPITGAKINFINKEVFIDQGDLLLSGTAVPSFKVLAVLKNINGSILAKTDTVTDKNGNWETKFLGPFKKGKYYVEVTTQDDRGATSLPVKSEIVKITSKPFLTIGKLRVTLVGFFALIILLLLLLFFIFYWYFKQWRTQIIRRDVLAQRDVLNLFNAIHKDLNAILLTYSQAGNNKHKNAEIGFLLKNSEKKLTKAEKYILDNIREIVD